MFHRIAITNLTPKLIYSFDVIFRWRRYPQGYCYLPRHFGAHNRYVLQITALTLCHNARAVSDLF